MSYRFKEFSDDCLRTGHSIAAYLTPAFMHRFSVPIAGAALGLFAAPVLIGCIMGYEKLTKNWEVWKRPKAGDAERSIRDVFGEVSAKGSRGYSGGNIELKLEEACIYNIYPNGTTSPEADCTRMYTHPNREQAAKDMLGCLAQGATSYGRSMSPGEERFIVVRKKGETSSKFYQAAHIQDPAQAPQGAIVATHHYYKFSLKKNEIEKEAHYAITPVDTATETRLKGLGL